MTAASVLMMASCGGSSEANRDLTSEPAGVDVSVADGSNERRPSRSSEASDASRNSIVEPANLTGPTGNGGTIVAPAPATTSPGAAIAGPPPPGSTSNPGSVSPAPPSSIGTAPNDQADPASTAPATTAPAPNAPAGLDAVSSLVDAAGDGWQALPIKVVQVERFAAVRAYFSDDGTPEDEPWLTVAKSVRPIEKECNPPFRVLEFQDDSIGCIRNDPNPIVRLLVDGDPTQIEGRLTTAQAIAAANAIEFPQPSDDSPPTVGSGGLPNGVLDHGEFVLVPGTNRAVSGSLIGSDVATVEYRHADGSTIEVTSAIDTWEAYEYLRLDRIGGWTLTPLTSVDGYNGKHRVLTDRMVVWFDNGVLVQARSTGTRGAAVIDQLTEALRHAE